MVEEETKIVLSRKNTNLDKINTKNKKYLNYKENMP